MGNLFNDTNYTNLVYNTSSLTIYKNKTTLNKTKNNILVVITNILVP